MKSSSQIGLAILIICVLMQLPLLFGHGCNEAVCASIVSKCMLTQSCKCELKNTTCSKDCFYCLDYLYTECCACVEMCPNSTDTGNFLSQKSHVEDLNEPFPDLFNVLTEEKDRLLRWVSYTYPAHLSFISLDKDIKFYAAKSGETPGESIPVNCTVAYMSQCMSWNKCKSSCSSMGASSYRWFHDGCCECVGSTCINYGINESRCLECPPEKDDMSVDEQDIIGKEKIDSERTKYIEEIDEVTESLSNKEEVVDKMQDVGS